jgi:hypothetical protein
MGDMCTCVGPPDTIILGSVGVMIGGKPAARMGDSCAHGGTIVLGCPTVLIGEVSPGSAVTSGGGGGSSAATSDGGGGGGEGGGGLAAMPETAIKNVINDVPPEVAVKLTQVLTMREAAEHGSALAHNPDTCEICKAKLQSGSQT